MTDSSKGMQLEVPLGRSFFFFFLVATLKTSTTTTAKPLTMMSFWIFGTFHTEDLPTSNPFMP